MHGPVPVDVLTCCNARTAALTVAVFVLSIADESRVPHVVIRSHHQVQAIFVLIDSLLAICSRPSFDAGLIRISEYRFVRPFTPCPVEEAAPCRFRRGLATFCWPLLSVFALNERRTVEGTAPDEMRVSTERSRFCRSRSALSHRTSCTPNASAPHPTNCTT